MSGLSSFSAPEAAAAESLGRLGSLPLARLLARLLSLTERLRRCLLGVSDLPRRGEGGSSSSERDTSKFAPEAAGGAAAGAAAAGGIGE